MQLLTYKWTASLVIFFISIIAGMTSFHVANKYQRWLALGDALANGIFIGAALFHLLPTAVDSFRQHHYYSPYLDSILIATCSFVILYLIGRVINLLNQNKVLLISIWLVVITLSIHAFVTGFALGLLGSVSFFTIIFFAVVIHKGFEIFALVVTLIKRYAIGLPARIITFLFTFVTPIGVMLGTYSDSLFNTQTDLFLAGLFNAIAAGTFFYIGTADTAHEIDFNKDSYKQYQLVLATLLGVAVMALLAIWI